MKESVKGPQETLGNIVRYMEELKGKLRAKQKELARSKSDEGRVRIVAKIAKLSAELRGLRKSFEEISTGVDLTSLSDQSEKKFKWDEELLELLKPVVHELKSITARPRQIERIRGKVAFYESRLPVVDEGIAQIGELISGAKTKKLKKQLKALEDDWKARRDQIANQLAIANLQLEEINSQKKPVIESIQNFVQGFFRERGRNLAAAVITFIGVLLLLRLMHRALHRNPLPKIAKRQPFFIRIFDLVYHAMTVLGATAAALAMLYVSGDWVLLSIAIIFLVGLFWAAKQGLPTFWEQTKLLLNLGPVREKERIFYDGISWRVEKLNFYTSLKNPALQNATIRLPIRELLSMNSYPYHSDDPWFPSNVGDWVILADGTRGQVIHQSHETVQLELRGGSRKTYLTDTFLGLNPQNLSVDFRLKIPFGLDYDLQEKITGEIPKILCESVERGLCAEGYEADINRVQVEFSAAAASSLDLTIICDFKGSAAALYNKLNRLIQRLAVEAATQSGWNIPYAQIVMHKAD